MWPQSIDLFSLFDFPVSNVGAHRKFVIVYFLVSNMEKQPSSIFVIVYSFFLFLVSFCLGSIQGIFKEHVSNEVAPVNYCVWKQHFSFFLYYKG